MFSRVQNVGELKLLELMRAHTFASSNVFEFKCLEAQQFETSTFEHPNLFQKSNL